MTKEVTKADAVGNDKFITRYAHSFKTTMGDIVIFSGIPTHGTEEECKTCGSSEMIVDMTGFEDNGPIPVKVLKADHNFVLTTGFAGRDTPLGQAMIVGGPAVEEKKAEMRAAGKRIPNPENEQDQEEAWERYMAEQKAMGAEASPPEALPPHPTMQ